LPIHSTSHPEYDGTTAGVIAKEVAEAVSDPTLTLTPAQARAVYEKAELRMRGLIIAGTWMPRLR